MGVRHQLIRLLLAQALFISISFAEPTWFVFWAKQPKNVDSISKVEKMLTNDAAKVNDKPAFKAISAHFLDGGKTKATWYWWVKIESSRTQDQDYKDLLKEDLAEIFDLVKGRTPPGVNPDPDIPFIPTDEDILRPAPDSDTLQKRTTSSNYESQQQWKGRMKRTIFASQPDAPRQLVFISLSADKGNDLSTFRDYRYDVNAGKGGHVFVIDSGLNFESSAWNSPNNRPKPNILYAGLGNKQEALDLDEIAGHGTCMADLAVGSINGVAKEAHLTAVQFDETSTQTNQKLAQEATLEAISAVVDNIHLRRQSPAFANEKYVVSMSFQAGLRNRGSDKSYVSAFFTALKELDDLGVALIASMPNNEICRGVPCRYGLGGDEVFPSLPNIITVSGGRIDNGDFVDDKGKVDDRDKMTIFAPSTDASGGRINNPGLICTNFEGDGDRPPGEIGNSHAGAFVAGLMAYHMGNGLDRDAARKLMIETAYPRLVGGPKMIWNGVT